MFYIITCATIQNGLPCKGDWNLTMMTQLQINFAVFGQ